ncbi:hypothetical protein Tco_0824312 [Tanacetum coccineum]|uniref:Reverse transcriptase domain-containing protein n=1 Tax=Tanacetum coccineum TaxID=301880 RepID=A0ABQ5ALC6_9ASTR
MEEDYEPTVQHQRRVNPKIHDVIKKEVEKLLDAGLIYPIFDSPWGGEYALTIEKLTEVTRLRPLSLPSWIKSREDSREIHTIVSLDGFFRIFANYLAGIHCQGYVITEKNKVFKRCQTLLLGVTTFLFTIVGSNDLAVVCTGKKHLTSPPEACPIGPTGDIRCKSSPQKAKGKISQMDEIAPKRYQVCENLLTFWASTSWDFHHQKLVRHRAIISDRGTHFCNVQFTKLKSAGQDIYIVQVFPYGVELSKNSGPNFKVMVIVLEAYFGGDVLLMDIPDLQTFPKDN